jgi:hypothetical protein
MLFCIDDTPVSVLHEIDSAIVEASRQVHSYYSSFFLLMVDYTLRMESSKLL